MQIQGSSVPQGVRSAPALRSPRAPEPNGTDCTKPRLPHGRAFFSRISENLFENRAGTARVELRDDGSIAVTSEIFGEFTGRIEGHTLVAQNESGDTFMADVLGDPSSGRFIVHNVRPADARPGSAGVPELLPLAALMDGGREGDGQPRVLDTLA